MSDAKERVAAAKERSGINPLVEIFIGDDGKSMWIDGVILTPAQLRALADAMEPPDGPSWRKDVPTLPGWYKWRSPGMEALTKLEYSSDKRSLVVKGRYDDGEEWFARILNNGGEWYGPVHAPTKEPIGTSCP